MLSPPAAASPQQQLSDMFDDVVPVAASARSRSASPAAADADANADNALTPQRPPRTTGLFLQASPSSAGGSPVRIREEEEQQRSNKRRRLAEMARKRDVVNGRHEGEGDRESARRSPQAPDNSHDSEDEEDIQRSALAMFDDIEAEDSRKKGTGILDPLAVATGGAEDTTAADMKDDGAAGIGSGRAPRARLDEQRLLGDRGFPLLMKTAKKFKIKGKGHETEDLARLISTYQIWAHQMFPKASFKDAVTKIESLCHSRSVQSTVRRWRDDEELERNAREAAIRKAAEMRPGGARNPIFTLLDLQDALSGAGVLRATSRTTDDGVDDYKESHGITREAIETYATRMEQEPERVVTLQDLIRASGGGGGDDGDEDEGRNGPPTEAAVAVATSASPESAARPAAPPRVNHAEEDEDFEAMIAAAEAEAAELQRGVAVQGEADRATTNPRPSTTARDDFEDDWAAMDELMA